MRLHLVWSYTDKELKGYDKKTLQKELKEVTPLIAYEKRLRAELKRRKK